MYKKDIEKYALHNPAQETCGFVLLNNYNQIEVTNELNIHSDPSQNFLINKNKYIQYKNIIAIWHSHVDQDEEPSSGDILYANELALPFCIFSLKTKGFYLYMPQNYKNNLFKNRIYVNGIFNCGTLVIDYFKGILNKYINTEGINFFKEEDAINRVSQDFFEEIGDINKIKKNDILKFKIKKNCFHFGVYLGGQRFFHQFESTLPTKMQLNNKWLRRVCNLYRYKEI